MSLPWDLTGWGEVAAFLGVSVATARRYATKHGLPVKRLCTGGVRARRRQLERWARSRLS